MRITDIYAGNLLEQAYERLQAVRERRDSNEPQRFLTHIAGPEVIDDAVLSDWLRFNYMYALDFDKHGRPIMGELGGVIHTDPSNGSRILGISEASVGKVKYGILGVQESRNTANTQLLSRIEQALGMPVESRANVTVINGNRNAAHYDFTTRVASKKPLELLRSDRVQLFEADGIQVLSNRRLDNERYVFNIPVNQDLFGQLRGLAPDDLDAKVAFLRSVSDDLIPPQFLAGVSIKYKDKAVTIRPLMTRRDAEMSFFDYDVQASDSAITHLGVSSPFGQLIAVLQEF